METYRLSQLSEYIKRAIILNFLDPVWLIAEIISLKEIRNNYYIELVERNQNGDVIAQIESVLWKHTSAQIAANRKISVTDLLAENREVKLKVEVDYNVRYGLKLEIKDIDPYFKTTQTKALRAHNIQKLVESGLWQKNKSTKLPLAIKKIAVIASEASAGYADFAEHLKENKPKYSFDLNYYYCSMQGSQMCREVCQALAKTTKAKLYDLIVIIRGGGSKLDLSDFDNLEIAEQISVSNTPVITGIGHSTDESLADLSAFLSLKTPTAVAEFIIQHNMQFEMDCMAHFNRILEYASKATLMEQAILQNTEAQMQICYNDLLHLEMQRLQHLAHHLKYSIKTYVTACEQELTEESTSILSSDPQKILEKGFAYILKDGKTAKLQDVKVGDLITTHVKDGHFETQVIRV